MRIEVWIALLSALLIAAVATPATGAPTPGAGDAQLAPKSDWRADNPTGSMQVPNTGTMIEIRSISAHGNFMRIVVRPVK